MKFLKSPTSPEMEKRGVYTVDCAVHFVAVEIENKFEKVCKIQNEIASSSNFEEGKGMFVKGCIILRVKGSFSANGLLLRRPYFYHYHEIILRKFA